jgi:nitric oxide reductase activation protein
MALPRWRLHGQRREITRLRQVAKREGGGRCWTTASRFHAPNEAIKEESKRSYEDRAPKLAYGFGPLQVLGSSLQRVATKRKGEGKKRKEKGKTTGTETAREMEARQETTRQEERKKTKQKERFGSPLSSRRSTNFGRAWVGKHAK